ncbi:apoptosis inhibitor [Paractinoplanes abujensis]|nr:apoptosis inhibitor [Actinoplanes abujensis]
MVLVLAGVFGASVGAARVGRHQARTAADLGALAGGVQAVFGPGTACARAARFVTANDGRLTSCVVEGLDIVVTAEVEVRVAFGFGGRAVATARAGPVYALPE